VVRWSIDGSYFVFLSSLISSLSKTEAKITMMTNRITPPSGFITSQLMIGVTIYAVINKAAKNKIMRNKRIVNISPTFSTFTVTICYDCLHYILVMLYTAFIRKIFLNYVTL